MTELKYTHPLPTYGVGVEGKVSSLRVTVIEGIDEGLQLVVDKDRLTIGRGKTASVVLNDPTVSQFHVEMLVSEGGLLTVDCGSKNGVRAGGVRIERGVIPYGTHLTLGETVVRVDPAGDLSTPELKVSSFGGLIGQTQAMLELYSVLDRLARTEISILIEGDTGTGKEMAGRAVHRSSARADRPFVVLDCTTIPSTLAASILFGHEKGAFPEAEEKRIGVFEAAHGGVLFIDEVGELPQEIQPLLLKVLQEREVIPVGSSKAKPVDVRVISATWRDLRMMVNRGTFREDLYYRLAQATVWVPSLAERMDDVGLLVRHFLDRLRGRTRARDISSEALESLSKRAFPGNIRELQATVERLAFLAESEVITQADLAFERLLAAARGRKPQEGDSTPPKAPDGPIEPFKEAKRTLIDEFERGYVARLMTRTNNNLTHAAAIAGLERHNLREILKKHGLYRPGGGTDHEPRNTTPGE